MVFTIHFWMRLNVGFLVYFLHDAIKLDTFVGVVDCIAISIVDTDPVHNIELDHELDQCVVRIERVALLRLLDEEPHGLLVDSEQVVVQLAELEHLKRLVVVANNKARLEHEF